MLTVTLAMVIVIIKLFPQSDLAVLLHRHLVEYPVERLARVERRHVIFALLVIAVLLLAQELIAVAGPADMAFVFLWDVSIYLDLTGVALTVAAVRWTKTVWTLARALPRRSIRIRSAHRRSIKTNARPKPANDDDVHRCIAA